MKATDAWGDLQEIEDCYILIGGISGTSLGGAGGQKLIQKILPDISDSKSASYNDEPIIGRSFPLKTYSHSENRTISWTMHFMVVKKGDAEENMKQLRAIESLVYPRDQDSTSTPFAPPRICQLKCGDLLTRGKVLCAILKSYSVKFPTDVVWSAPEKLGLIPHKFDVDMQFDVVYNSTDLPGEDVIFSAGM
jgi:hypothetical protein